MNDRQRSAEVVVNKRKDPHELWTFVNSGGIHSCRTIRRRISLRISDWWFGTVWNINNPVGRKAIICRDKIRRWAYKNALTLVFLLGLFSITWTIQIVSLLTR